MLDISQQIARALNPFFGQTERNPCERWPQRFMRADLLASIKRNLQELTPLDIGAARKGELQSVI